MKFLLPVCLLIGASYAQFLHQPIPYAFQPQIQEVPIAHRAVVENSLRDAELPGELIKSNDFYRNPKTANALAKESWFTDKEMPVFEREAEKIPRENIYKIFKNAGFVRRR